MNFVFFARKTKYKYINMYISIFSNTCVSNTTQHCQRICYSRTVKAYSDYAYTVVLRKFMAAGAATSVVEEDAG